MGLGDALRARSERSRASQEEIRRRALAKLARGEKLGSYEAWTASKEVGALMAALPAEIEELRQADDDDERARLFAALLTKTRERRHSPARRPAALARLAVGLKVSSSDAGRVRKEVEALKWALPGEIDELRQADDDDERARLFACLVVAASDRRREFRESAAWLDANSPPPPLPKVEVRQYKTAVEFERHANRRIPLGWVIQHQTQETGQTHRVKGAMAGAIVGSIVLMPTLGAAAGALGNRRDSGEITVTWFHPGTTVQKWDG